MNKEDSLKATGEAARNGRSTSQFVICEQCGHIQQPRQVARYVKISGELYLLGQTSRRGSQIQCIAPDGLVHRVCYWEPQGIAPGTRIHTSGQILEYLA